MNRGVAWRICFRPVSLVHVIIVSTEKVVSDQSILLLTILSCKPRILIKTIGSALLCK